MRGVIEPAHDTHLLMFSVRVPALQRRRARWKARTECRSGLPNSHPRLGRKTVALASEMMTKNAWNYLLNCGQVFFSGRRTIAAEQLTAFYTDLWRRKACFGRQLVAAAGEYRPRQSVNCSNRPKSHRCAIGHSHFDDRLAPTSSGIHSPSAGRSWDRERIACLRQHWRKTHRPH